MAQLTEVKVVKHVDYEEFLNKVKAKYAVPIEQIEETFEQVTDVLGETLRDLRPSKVGQCIQVETPMALIRARRVPAEIRADANTNEKFQRDECVVLSMSPAIRLINTANLGLVATEDGESEAEAGKKIKTA